MLVVPRYTLKTNIQNHNKYLESVLLDFPPAQNLLNATFLLIIGAFFFHFYLLFPTKKLSFIASSLNFSKPVSSHPLVGPPSHQPSQPGRGPSTNAEEAAWRPWPSGAARGKGVKNGETKNAGRVCKGSEVFCFRVEFPMIGLENVFLECRCSSWL